MKRQIEWAWCRAWLVAPRAGAWIETSCSGANRIRAVVAHRAGAWIETRDVLGRDLAEFVAPRAGAWIETRIRATGATGGPSPPARGRGLKPSAMETYASPA